MMTDLKIAKEDLEKISKINGYNKKVFFLKEKYSLPLYEANEIMDNLVNYCSKDLKFFNNDTKPKFTKTYYHQHGYPTADNIFMIAFNGHIRVLKDKEQYKLNKEAQELMIMDLYMIKRYTIKIMLKEENIPEYKRFMRFIYNYETISKLELNYGANKLNSLLTGCKVSNIVDPVDIHLCKLNGFEEECDKNQLKYTEEINKVRNLLKKKA